MGFQPESKAPDNYHRHKCYFCGFVWEHHDCNDVRHGDYGAHECPGCHRCNWSLGIYEGGELPRVRNGKEPIVPSALFKDQIHPDQGGGG